MHLALTPYPEPQHTQKVKLMETKSGNCLQPNQSCQQVVLISAMHSQIKIAGVNIIFAALSPKTCASILCPNNSLSKNDSSLLYPSSDENVYGVLKRLVDGNERFQLFFNNSSTVVCDRISIAVDKLELHNLKVVNINQTLISPYRPLEYTQGSEAGFVLFGFYELPQ